MRDIRGDLQERATLLEEKLEAAQAQFEKCVEQIKDEHDSRLKDLKSGLEAVNALLGIEHRRHGGAPSAPKAQPQPPQPQSQRPKPQQPLADFLIRKLSEVGPLSKDGIRQLTVQEGYFADGDAERGVQTVLMHVAKAGHIRQLPNGEFALPSVMETIRLRRAI
jgi:hypothetical protein